MVEDFEFTKSVFGDGWQFVQQRVSYPSEAFKKFVVYDKPLSNLKKGFSLSLTIETPNTKTTNQIIREEFGVITALKLIEFYSLRHVLLSTIVFCKYGRDFLETYGLNFFFKSLSRYPCALYLIEYLIGDELYLSV